MTDLEDLLNKCTEYMVSKPAEFYLQVDDSNLMPELCVRLPFVLRAGRIHTAVICLGNTAMDTLCRLLQNALDTFVEYLHADVDEREHVNE